MGKISKMGKSAAIGIMCKAPLPGRTKTRLAAAIGAESAAALSACFLRDVAATIETIPDSLARKGYGVYAPAGAEAELRRILPPSFGLLLQADAEFGNVLYGAARDLLAAGHDCVMLVNSDGPTLPASFYLEAIGVLRRPGDRMVLGPSVDGGYYLIGLKAAHRPLFTDIPWGTESVSRLTIERAAKIGLEVVLLPEWYDVDDGESLDWLRQELAGRSDRFPGGAAAEATRAFLGTPAEAAK
jgi:rSAM/selenodomain-associated transferase 1